MGEFTGFSFCSFISCSCFANLNPRSSNWTFHSELHHNQSPIWFRTGISSFYQVQCYWESLDLFGKCDWLTAFPGSLGYRVLSAVRQTNDVLSFSAQPNIWEQQHRASLYKMWSDSLQVRIQALIFIYNTTVWAHISPQLIWHHNEV